MGEGELSCIFHSVRLIRIFSLHNIDMPYVMPSTHRSLIVHLVGFVLLDL